MAVSGTIGQEAAFLGVSVLLGAGLFLLYDGFRILRRVIPHGTIWIGMEDFLYWVICTAAVFVLLYTQNDGKVRGYAIGGIAVGMMLYYALFSRFIVQAMVFLVKKLTGGMGRTIRFVCRPFYVVWKKIYGFFRKQLKKLWKAVRMSLCKH